VSPWAPCSGSEGYDLTGQPDGAYTFAVRATDVAGNTGDPASSVYVLDTSPPVTAITSGPAPFSSEQNPEWSFTSEAEATTECELSSTLGGVLQPFAPCVSPQSYDLAGQPDDSYTLSVRATDPAGNLGPTSSSGYSLDTSGPTSSISSSPASPGNSLSPSWGFTAEAGATTECELSGGAGVLSPWTPCLSPQSFNLTGQPDGPFTFSVRATDAAGNIGAPASNTYTLDTSAPATSITSAPTSPGSSRDPSWTFTTEPGAATQCELSRGGVVLTPWSSCVSPATHSLDGQADGTYTFRVRATDGAGNTGPSQASTYTLDTTGPSVSIVPPGSPGNDRSPTWTFSSEAGASSECELSRGSLILQPFASCVSPATHDLTVQPDGAYTLRVRATDAAGNTGSAASAVYELDTTGPATTIVSGPPSPGSSTSVTWTFTTEAGGSTECGLTDGAGVVQPFSSCSSSKRFDISGGSDGEYTFRVRATDAAGNVGPEATSSYVLDRTPPAVPIITSGPGSPGSEKSVSWSFTAEVGMTTECELTRAGSVVQPFGPCTSPSESDLTGGPDGEYTFAVRAVDGLGNTSASATGGYTLDTTGPSVSITSEPKSPSDRRNPTWTFTTEAGASVRCTIGRGGIEVDADRSCVSPVSFDLGGEPDSTYTLRVTATDVAGNEGPTATSRYVLDTVGGGTEPVPVAEPRPQTTQPVTGPVQEPDDEPSEEAEQAPVRRGSYTPPTVEEEEAENPLPPAEEAREVSESSPKTRGALGEFLDNVGTVAAGLLEQPAFPLSLVSTVFGFLVLQNRVDRRDPKLAMAPVYPDPHLYFDPQEGPGKVHMPSGGTGKGPMT
jgi:predicted phage tail protein